MKLIVKFKMSLKCKKEEELNEPLHTVYYAN